MLVLLIALLFIQPVSVQAHPADIYTHTFNLTLTPQGLLVGWEIKPGPLVAARLWYEADQNEDESISEEEALVWGESRVARLSSTLDDAPFSLQIDDVQFPEELNGLQSNNEPILFMLSAPWPQDGGNTHRLSLHNGVEEQSSINWFNLQAIETAAFQQPIQQSSQIAVDFLREREQASDQSLLLTKWDSGTPSLPPGQSKDVVMQTAEQVIPELAQQTPQEILIGLVKQQEFSIAFYILALGISLALGALHALTPGHGKTIVAAYLVGTRGTARHAIALGSIVTLTHTGSVFLLGVVTLVASRYILPTSLIPALEVLSGLLILGLGLYLLIQRIRDWRNSKNSRRSKRSHRYKRPHSHKHASNPHHDHGHAHDHTHSHEHEHDHGHTHHIPDPDNVTWRSLIALGVSGGLVPCPDAIAILLVAVAINRLLLGLSLIVAFSLGLAVVLIVIGLAMVQSSRLFQKIDAFNKFAPALPVVSAVIVLALGTALTWGAMARFGSGENAIAGFLPGKEAGLSSTNEALNFRLDDARVIYLSEDDDGRKQLFISNLDGEPLHVLTDSPRGVNGYALSPDREQVVFVRQAADLSTSLWLARVDGNESREIITCDPAICSQPIWSPDGKKIVYESLDFGDEGNGLGLPSLWWLDVESGETQPVFQDVQLPGSNPRWSPDGNWLSYSTADGSIRLYNLSTGENRVLNNFLGAAAVWASDSRSVLLRDVLTQDQSFVTHVFRYDLESGELTDVNDDPTQENNLAAWSPDGARIAMVRRDLSISMGDQIWLMGADGTQARQMTEAPNVLHGSLNWSPDGRYVLFDGYLLDVFPLEAHLQVLDVESGEVTDLGVKGYSPAWVW